MLNRLFALILLIVLSPLFLIIALLIVIDDGFPVFFKQKRAGINYSFFIMYKFRTMKKATPNVPTHLLTNSEQYILKIGSILRKLSLDELPNLINIGKGEMGFVGPRPALFSQDNLMKLRIDAGVDKILPGLTGLAQINGRDELTIEKKVEYEIEYMKKKSLLFDLQIILKTFTSTLFSKGVSH